MPRARLAARSGAALVAALLLASTPGAGAEPLSPPDAVAAVEALLDGDRSRAESLLAALEARSPDDPVSLLARLQAGWWETLAGREPDVRLDATFAHLCASAEARLDRDPADVGAQWALGEAHCTLGRLAGLDGRAWAAFRHHRAGVPLLEAVERRRPDAPEPRASLGLYRYYAARLPRPLRVLGRLLVGRGDRRRGLADLERAAGEPGLQRALGAFFRVEVLVHGEDEPFAALPEARALSGRWPRQPPFALELGEVLVALDRPDLAVRHLAGAAARAGRGPEAVQLEVFTARVLAESGCAEAALERLAAFAPGDRESVPWLAGWCELERGLALWQLGHAAEARAALERALASPDVAGCREAARRWQRAMQAPLERARLAARARRLWDADPAAARAILEEGLRLHPAAVQGPDYLLESACASLALGEPARALAPLERCVAQERAPGRAHTRYLQALLWSGRLDEARSAAAEIAEELGPGADHPLLRSLVAGCIEPASPRWPACAAAGGAPVRFHVRDLGFTSVTVVLPGRAGEHLLPLRFGAGSWEADLPLAPGMHRYVLELEGGVRVLDPEAEDIATEAGETWSVRRVPPASS